MYGLEQTPAQTTYHFVPPKIPLVSWISITFGKYVKTLKNPVKMALGRFEILFIFIPKPLQVWVSSHQCFPSHFI